MNDKNSLTESPVIVGTTPPSPIIKLPPPPLLLNPPSPKLSPKPPPKPSIKHTHAPSAKIGNYIYYHPAIGKGSSSKVYTGFSLVTNQIVAVKKINSVSIQKLSLNRIMSEMELMKGLDHPNIVKYIDFLQDNNYVYIITEYCNGGTLQKFMDDMSGYIKSFDELEVKFFMRQIKDAFQYLHSKNIYHRDVKPQNIFLYYNKTIHTNYSDVVLKIGDFGFAKEIFEEDMENTLCGTPLYISPEILIKNKYHLLSDLWSIGVILHQFFYGQFPYGKAKNILELIKCIQNVKLEFPIKKYVGKINISLEGCDLLSSLLEINPDDRINWEEFFNHAWFVFRDEKTREESEDEISDDDDEINEKINEFLNEEQKQTINKDIDVKKKRKDMFIIEDYCDKVTTSLPIPIPLYKKRVNSPTKTTTALTSIYRFLTQSIENIKKYTNNL